MTSGNGLEIMVDPPISSQPNGQISQMQTGAREKRHDIIGAVIAVLTLLTLAFFAYLDQSIVVTLAFGLLQIFSTAVGFFLGGKAIQLKINGNT